MLNSNSRKHIYAKAPLRISFCGGGTDLAPFSDEHGGVVLSTTINKYSITSLAKREDRAVSLNSFDFGDIVNINYNLNERPVYDGVLDLAKAVIDDFAVEEGFDLFMYTDAPPASGLGTSSTFTVSIIGAMREYLGLNMDAYEIAEKAHYIERVKLGYHGGKQDQYAAAFGGFNLIEFSKDKTIVTPLKLSAKIVNDLESHILLCYTGKTHFSSNLIKQQISYYKEKRIETIDGLHQIKKLTYELKDCLVRGDVKKFAEIMSETWRIKKSINPEVTNSDIDEIYDIALKNGAIGGKLLGAGGGGFLLLFCPITKRRSLVENLEKIGVSFMSFGLDKYGLKCWRSSWN